MADKSEVLGSICEALYEAERFFVHRDEMNAAVHCSEVRLSPVTTRVQEAFRLANDLLREAERG